MLQPLDVYNRFYEPVVRLDYDGCVALVEQPDNDLVIYLPAVTKLLLYAVYNQAESYVGGFHDIDVRKSSVLISKSILNVFYKKLRELNMDVDLIIAETAVTSLGGSHCELDLILDDLFTEVTYEFSNVS